MMNCAWAGALVTTAAGMSSASMDAMGIKRCFMESPVEHIVCTALQALTGVAGFSVAGRERQLLQMVSEQGRANSKRFFLRFPLAAPVQQQHRRDHHAVDNLPSRFRHLRDRKYRLQQCDENRACHGA